MRGTAAGAIARTAAGRSSGSDAAALPSWLLVGLLCLVGLVVLAMFVLTAYSLSAPRSTLKNVLGRSGPFGRGRQAATSDNLVSQLALAARVGRRTTRTTLAIGAFALLGVVVIAIFGASGQGVRDLRSQAVAAVTTLAATIAGFYFGAQTASNKSEANGSGQAVAKKHARAPKHPPDLGHESLSAQGTLAEGGAAEGGAAAGGAAEGGPAQPSPAQSSVVLTVQPVVLPAQPVQSDPDNPGNAGNFQAS